MGVRKYKDVRRVYFDMDGVLADFERAFTDAGLTVKEFKLKQGSYLSIPTMKGALEAVELALELGFEIFALTKIPTKNPHSATEKIIWLNDNFPQFGDHIILSPDKGVVGKPVDILIDDHPEWANADKFPGHIVKFSGDWKEVKDLLKRLDPNIKIKEEVQQ